nr:hypothetical protein CFP56_37325 [Quercus suber]
MPSTKSFKQSSQALPQKGRTLNAKHDTASSTSLSRVPGTPAGHARGKKSSATSSVTTNASDCHKPGRGSKTIAAAARDASRSPPPLESDEEASVSDTGSDESYGMPDSPRSDAASQHGENATWAQLPPSATNYAAPDVVMHHDSTVREDSPQLEDGGDNMDGNWSISQWLGDDSLKRMDDMSMSNTSLPARFHVRLAL